MASAMTPEPTVAIVLLARGDIRREDNTGVRPLGRGCSGRARSGGGGGHEQEEAPGRGGLDRLEAGAGERRLEDRGLVP